MLETIRTTITNFCMDFVRNPYECYTEHGQHALFYSMLFSALSEQQRFITWKNQKVCALQKEYPTAGKLGKPKRQHWDIAILKSPPESCIEGGSSYDYLKLFAVVEFGMNGSAEHLNDDIARLCHKDANLEHGFIVHLYRLSKSGALFSGRDWGSSSPRILTLEDVQSLSVGKPVEIFYGVSDSTGNHHAGVWSVKDGVVIELDVSEY